MVELLSVGEAAAQLGITPGAARKRIQSGTLQAQRVGPRVYVITAEEVERAKQHPPAGKGGRPLKANPKPLSVKRREYRQRAKERATRSLHGD
jgi:excisionase family DNA binding protein